MVNVGLSQNHYTTQRTDSVEQMHACIIEKLLTALVQFPLSLFEIGTSKNGVKKELPILQSLLCTLMSDVNVFTCVSFSYLSYSVVFLLVVHVCTVSHAVCI